MIPYIKQIDRQKWNWNSSVGSPDPAQILIKLRIVPAMQGVGHLTENPHSFLVTRTPPQQPREVGHFEKFSQEHLC